MLSVEVQIEFSDYFLEKPMTEESALDQVRVGSKPPSSPLPEIGTADLVGKLAIIYMWAS